MVGPIRKFLTKVLLLLCVLLVFDQALGLLLEQVYFSLRRGQLAETTYAIEKAKQDILIFGSSRAIRHYVPSVITRNIPNTTCYNVGKDAERAPYYAAVQEMVLARQTPKLIVLDILPNEFDTDKSKYLKLSALLPYCRTHQELIKYVQEIDKFEKYKLHSRTYPFNSMIFVMLSNFAFGGKTPKSDNGFTPLEKTLTEKMVADLIVRKKEYDANDSDPNGEKIDQKAVSYFRAFLETANRKHIKTLIVISPSLLGEKVKVRKSLIESIARQYPNVSFYDFSNDVNFVHQNHKFADMFHLNKAGAEEFSGIIATYIKSAYPSG